MNVVEIEVDKSKQYTFEEAKRKIEADHDLVITSAVTGDSYIAEVTKGKVTGLKYYNSALVSWRKCDGVEPREIFNDWYITKQ